MVQIKSDADVGVVLCDCGGELSRRLDFTSLEKNLSGMGAVNAVKRCSKLCDAKECSDAVQSLQKSGASRIVVGGCEHDALGASIGETLKGSGLNAGLIWTANISEQCGLVHKNKEAATEKANRRLAAAVNRVIHSESVKTGRYTISTDVAVIGGGIPGKQAALTLAGLGHRVAYLQKGSGADGIQETRAEFYGYLGDDPYDVAEHIRNYDKDLNQQIAEHENIQEYTGSEIKSLKGEIGNFSLKLSGNGELDELTAGALVVTSAPNGAASDKVSKRGRIPGVVDLNGLLKLIRSGEVFGHVAMLTGYYGEKGCSISAQVLSAAELMANRFGVQVKLYCNHVHVAATGIERLYRRARAAGVVIIKSEKPPAVTGKSGKVVITSDDHIAGVEISDVFDLAVIAEPDTAGNGNGIMDFLKDLSLGQGSALVTDNVWLQPALTNRPGVCIIGDSRGSGEYRKALTGGLAAAHEIHSLLSDGTIEQSEDAAVVDEGKCAQCLTCVRICPHGAIHFDVEVRAASVSSLSCQRCGICASVCPAKAITMPGYSDEQINADVGENPRITVFACKNSAIPAANAASVFGFEYEPDVELISVPCSGRVDAQVVLSALEAGAEKVFVLGCHPESCKYLTGSSHASVRMDALTSMLDEVGIDGSRVQFGGIASVESPRFIEYVTG